MPTQSFVYTPQPGQLPGSPHELLFGEGFGEAVPGNMGHRHKGTIVIVFKRYPGWRWQPHNLWY